MKTDLTTPGSFAQSKALKAAETSAGKNSNLKALPGKLPSLHGPDYKVDLSGATKTPPTSSGISMPDVPLPKPPSLPDLPKPDFTGDLAKDQVKDSVKEEVKTKAKEVKDLEVKEGSVKKPAIFFIKGLDIFSSPLKSEGGYAGVGRLAESVEGSRIYGWDQKEEIMKEIRKTHRDYPVILVGHSLGGDTAIEIADELDSLKSGFRKIDLLVTMDAVGFSHDIIPQNVKKHFNVFGENGIINDGPHVARREEMTSVRNLLSQLDHTDIDDDREVQYEIVNLIQQTLKDIKA